MRIPLFAAALAAIVPLTVRAQCSTAVQRLIADQRLDDARTAVQVLLRRNDKDDHALHCMGVIALAEDKPGDAVDWFEKSVKANDSSSTHHLWLANSLGEQASHTSKFKLPFLARRVKGEFDKAAQLDPSSIDAHHGLILFYSQAPGVMGGSMDKAKDQAREIGKLSAWRGHVEMAALFEHDKDIASAEKEYVAASVAAPDSAGAQNPLAAFYRRQKRWSESVAVYDAVLKRHADLANERLNIAAALNQSGENLDRAERETRAWLAAPPSDAPKANFSVAHWLLGQFAERQGKKDLARSEYQQALTLNAKNSAAKQSLDGLR